MGEVIVIGSRDRCYGDYINTTSQSRSWSMGLSPFHLKNIDLYGKYKAKNMENAWQYAKLYPEHANTEGSPTEAYFEWATKGWNSSYAQRYPMGKGTIPLCSLWDGKKLGYVDARKEIYIPLYAKAVVKTLAFKQLKLEYEKRDKLVIWDFDGYDHKKLGMSYDDVINSSVKKMGHVFVLAMLLDGELIVDGNSIILK